MEFPAELWTDEQDRQYAEDLVRAFEGSPLILTDRLANSNYLTPQAAHLLGDSEEALVNRLSFSLLGFGKHQKVPTALVKALEGEGPSWRGVVDLGEMGSARWHFCEASAVVRDGRLVCGVIRLSPKPAREPHPGEKDSSGRSELKTAVLVSGRGSNLRALLDARAAGRLPEVDFVAVVSNNPKAPALDIAREHGIEAIGISHRQFDDRAAHERAVVEKLKERGAEFVVLAGYMRVLTPEFLHAFPNRVINIHPSLLPAFPGVNGQGQAVEYGVRIAGLTVHFVDEHTDHGPIILQRSVPVLQTDNDARLSARILEEEHRALPLALDLFSRGRLLIDGRKVVILKGETSFPELEESLHAVDPLLIATGNDHKLGEIAAIIHDVPVRLIGTRSFPEGEEPEENGTTYEENARIKATEWQRRTGLWTLADDSGLEVDALDGRPGIHSSRYAPTSKERIKRLLKELEGVPEEKRSARFVCTMVLLGPNGEEYVETGICPGHIGKEPRGEGGFGYDPVFVPEGFHGQHLAELNAKTKNGISHRARALEQIKGILNQIFGESR